MKEGQSKGQKCQDDCKGCYWSNTSLTGAVKQLQKGAEKRKSKEKAGEKKEVKVKKEPARRRIICKGESSQSRGVLYALIRSHSCFAVHQEATTTLSFVVADFGTALKGQRT